MKFRLLAGFAAALLLSCVSFAQADWTQRFPANSPSPRSNPAMAQFGNKVLLFGGMSGSGIILGDTWLWDGTNWTQLTKFGLFGTGPQPPARTFASMSYDPDTGQVVLFGGFDSNGNFLSDTWIFGQFSNALLHRTFFSWGQPSLATNPPARAQASMEFDPQSNRVILTSGRTLTTFFRDSWAFDSGSSTVAPSWKFLTSSGPDPARSNAAMAMCGITAQHAPDRILLFGGIGAETIGPNPPTFGDSWIYRDSQFTSLLWGEVFPSTAPPARSGHGIAYYPISGQDVMYGGQAEQISAALNDTWNGTCGSWSQANPAHNPGRRAAMGMAVGEGGFNIVLFGGVKQIGGSPSVQIGNDTWTWGRRAACLPTDGSVIPVGTTIHCKFDQIEGVTFGGWSANGFAPPFRMDLDTEFHTKAPGEAAITGEWSDETGGHSQTYHYTIVVPHNRN